MLPSNMKNDSSEEYTDDDILITRGTRPNGRRRSSSPRDVVLRTYRTTELKDNSSNINQTDFAASSTENHLNSSHSTVLESKKTDLLPSFVNPGVPNLDHVSVLPTRSNSQPTSSWVDSQDASQSIRQATSSISSSQTGRRNDPTNIAAQMTKPKVPIPILPSRRQQKEESIKRKEGLEKMQSKLKYSLSQSQLSRSWSIATFQQKEQSALTNETPPDDPSDAVAATPLTLSFSSPPQEANPPSPSFPVATKRSNPSLEQAFESTSPKRISSTIETNGSISTFTNFDVGGEGVSSRSDSSSTFTSPRVSSASNTSSLSRISSGSSLSTLSDVELQTPRSSRPLARYSRKKKTLTQRFILALTSGMASVSSAFSRVVQKFINQDVLNDYFEDGVDISSDYEDNWSFVEDEDQMDSEWLKLSDFEMYDSPTRPVMLITPSEQLTNASSVRSTNYKRISANHYPLKFLYVVLPVYKALLYLGRFPFEIDLNEDIRLYKLNTESWRYFLFVGTSVLAILASFLMLANLMRITTARDPLTFHETVLRLEHEKYWIEGTLEIVNMIFVAVSSVSLLKYGGGVFLVDFLNRWSQSVSIIRYDVTSGLKNLVYSVFAFYGIYAGIIIVLFFAGGENIPTVRGMCGYTGILILNTFIRELRLRPNFRAVEFIGLFVHLYITLAGSLVIVVISMQCWALNNAARKFNRRLAGCLRGIGFRSPPSNFCVSRVVVPYRKLFAEHLVITSFPKQIGDAFFTGFILSLGCKMVELIITLFGFVEPIFNGFPESDQMYFNVSAQSHFDPKLVVPIMIVEPSHIQSIKCCLYVAKTWLPWLIFMEIVQRPGTSIIRGASLIVRCCYIQCKTTHALRFIASMKFSFSNRAVFFVNPGAQITRSFIGKLLGFALLIFVTLIQFGPSEVNSHGVVICDHLGGCFLFQFPAKSRSRDGFQGTIGKTISDENQKVPKRLLPPPNYEEDFQQFQLSFPPCVSRGLLPKGPVSFGLKCSHEEDTVYIPTYFTKSSNKFIQIPPTPDHSCVKSLELPLNEPLFDCYGELVSVVESDECGNPKLANPDFRGDKQLPDLRVVKFNSSEIFCCYAYSGLENQAERCNLVSTEAGSHKCTRKSQTEDRIKYEKSISAEWDISDEIFVRNRRELWTHCLCQGLEGIPISKSICAAGDLTTPKTTPTPSVTATLSTSTSTTPATIKTTTTTTTPYIPEGPCPEYTPVIGYEIVRNACRMCELDPRRMFRINFFYRCPVEGRFLTLPNPLKLVRDPNDLIHPVPWRYPCEKQTTIQDRSEENGDYYDCYGQFQDMQSHGLKDDCGTRRLSFPNKFNGRKQLPFIKVVRLDSGNPPSPGAVFLFVCCWNYEQWQDSKVDSKCNLYPGSDLTKVCSLRSATSEADAIETCNDNLYGLDNKLYLEKCVDRNGKRPLKTCQNGELLEK